MHVSKDQFEVFLMVYAAYADFKERPLETSFILNTYGEERYLEALELYNRLQEYERVQIIIAHLEDFKDQAKKLRIISDIKSLLDFDGFNRFEATFYNYLQSVTEDY